MIENMKTVSVKFNLEKTLPTFLPITFILSSGKSFRIGIDIPILKKRAGNNNNMISSALRAKFIG
jgi:hypothetical protein